MMRGWKLGLVAVVASSAVGVPAVAHAQTQATGAETPGAAAPAADQAGGGGGGGGAGGGQVQTGTVTNSTTTSVTGVQFYPGGVAPTPAGQPVGGGNATESSSRARSGDDEDTFDLGPKTGGKPSVVHGDANGAIFVPDSGEVSGEGMAVPLVHDVQRGDTLWAICERYFRNPYQWPRVWSYNPQIQNPHWIEVGEKVRLRTEEGAPPARVAGRQETVTGSRLVIGQRVPPTTVFLREEGFLDKKAVEGWGEISGAPEDKMFLSDTDVVYVRVAPGHSVRLGEELTVFRPVRETPQGKVVQLQGTVRVNEYDAKTHIARATIIETLDVIERGARLAAIPRRFEVVPPVRNDVDVTAHIVATLHQHPFYGQNQVVYVDKGSDDGLRPGNTLVVYRQGDAWWKTQPARTAAKRIAIESSSPAAIESVPGSGNESRYPEERRGELRVIETHGKTSMCLVMQSNKELDPNDAAVARKGY